MILRGTSNVGVVDHRSREVLIDTSMPQSLFFL